SALLLFLAIHAKESAYALPLVFLVADMGRASSGGIGAGLKHALGRLPAAAPLLVALGLGLAIRLAVLGSLVPGDGGVDPIDNPLFAADPLTRAANALRLMACSVPIVFGLNPLSANYRFSADYSADQVTALGAFAPGNLIGIVALLAMVAGSVVLFSRCRTRASLVLAYFASLLIVSNLFFPIGTIFAERLLFFPSVLAVLFVAPFLARFGTAGLGVAVLLAAANGYWTHARASVFSNNAEVWSYTAEETAPDSARAHYNNGIAYARDQLSSLAATEFERAIEIAPQFLLARTSLAAIQLRDYQYESALTTMRETVERMAERDGWAYAEEQPNALVRYQALLFQMTTIDAKDPKLDPERNLASLDSLLERGLERPEVHVYRGETLVSLGREEEGEAAMRRAIELGSTPLAVDTLAQFYESRGRADEAQAVYDERLANLQASDDPAAIAAFKLQTGELELGSNSDRAFELAEEVLAAEEVLTPTLRSEALILRAQARLDRAASDDPVAESRAIAEGVNDFSLALASRGARSDRSFAALSTLATLLMLQGRDEPAESALVDAIGFLPGPQMQLRLGQIRLRGGRPDAALDAFDLALEGLMNEDGLPLEADLYLQARLGQLDALRRSSLPDKDSRIEAALAEEAARGDFQAAAVRAIHFARTDNFVELESALLQLRAASELGEGLAARVQAYAETQRELRQSPNNIGLLTRVADLSRSVYDAERGLSAIERAIDLGANADGDAQAFRVSLQASLLEQLGRVDEALPLLVEALEVDGLSEGGRSVIQGNLDRLTALLGR
ncbi:MAG: hypothetical protein AAFZ65_02540, partial [Planctomycetota bacterium]